MAGMESQDLANRIERNMYLVRNSPYIPFEPTNMQWAFICDDRPEILMGGGAGGGKSFALLADALKWVHVPGYAAVIFRKTFPDLMQPSGLIPLAQSWLTKTDARQVDGGKKWLFPSGATLMFAHLENASDRFKYAGLEAQFIGWDEVAQMEYECYEFLVHSRQRRSLTISPQLAEVPIRARSTANPGQKHAKWVKDYFISDDDGNPVVHPDRLYLHSTLLDNPHLDQEDYLKRLAKLDPVQRAQLQRGDWSIMPSGNMFAEEGFRIVDGKMPGDCHRVRAWDLAGSDKKKSDYCAGVLMVRSRDTGLYRIEHVVHDKYDPANLEKVMRQTAELDGRDVPILVEEERAGSGKLVLSYLRRTVLKGFRVHASRPVGDKVLRAGLLSALVDRGELELTRARWNDKFIAECVGFPDGAHDDMVDAAASAAHFLERLPIRKKSVPDSSQEDRLVEEPSPSSQETNVNDVRKQVQFLVSRARGRGPGRNRTRGLNRERRTR